MASGTPRMRRVAPFLTSSLAVSGSSKTVYGAMFFKE